MQLNPNCRVQPRPQDLSLVLGLGREEAKGTSAEGKGEVLETRLFTVLFFKSNMQRRCFELVKFTIDSKCLRALLFPDIYDGFRKPWFYEGTGSSLL